MKYLILFCQLLCYLTQPPATAASSLDTILHKSIESANFLSNLNWAKGPGALKVLVAQEGISTRSYGSGSSSVSFTTVKFLGANPASDQKFRDGKHLLEHFDFGLYTQLVGLLPKVAKAIENTIFEVEPTQQVMQFNYTGSSKSESQNNFEFKAIETDIILLTWHWISF